MATTSRYKGVAQDFGNIPVVQFVIEQRTADPTGAGLVEGRIWENTTDHFIKAYRNGAIDVFASTGSSLTEEQVEDYVAAMLAPTHTGITVTYTDNGASPGTLTLAVTDSPLLGGQNSAYHRNRANHTGSQLSDTISDFDAAALSAVGAGAPTLLNTIDELAQALGDDPNAITTITTSLGNRIQSLTAQTIAGNAGTTSAAFTTTSRDSGCVARFDDGDYEAFDISEEHPTTTSMIVRFAASTRPIRLLPWQR